MPTLRNRVYAYKRVSFSAYAEPWIRFFFGVLRPIIALTTNAVSSLLTFLIYVISHFVSQLGGTEIKCLCRKYGTRPCFPRIGECEEKV
jgi:hypothetical protein